MDQAFRDTIQPMALTTGEQLLRTKLAPPRLSAPLVPRTALLARIDQGLARKLTLVSAPAGFGKSTLLSQWAAMQEQHADGPRVAWVTLDAGDNEPVRFWRYVITACQARLAPAGATEHGREGGNLLGGAALALLHGPGQPPFDAVLASFINDLAQLTGRCVLILEDYHLIELPRLHEMMIFLIDHLPAALHLILLTRQAPPFPLARLRARHELHELGAPDLRFSDAEIELFLRQTVPAPLSPETVARLAARTEGWAVGLRLASLAVQGRQTSAEVEHYLANFSGSHGHLSAYLAGEVLAAQPAPVQAFLMQTAFLDRLTGSLCDAVTGREDSALLLEQLTQANLFLIPLDDAGHWYHYHGLFAEAMRHYARRRLGETEIAALHEKASRWYEAHGLLNEAIESALRGQAFARAATLIQQALGPGHIIAEYHTLRRWLEQLPHEMLQPHPALALTYALAILFSGDRRSPATIVRLQAPLAMAERTWQAEDNRPRLGAVEAVRALAYWWAGDPSQSFAAARRALTLLPEDDRHWRAVILTFTGVEEQMAGEIYTARQTGMTAYTLNETVGNIYGKLSAMQLLGDCAAALGELQQAATFYRQIVAATQSAPMERYQSLVHQAWALTGLGAVCLEWNDLAAAEEAASQARAIGEQLAEEYHLVHASLVLARVWQAQGQADRAQALLQALMGQVSQQQWPFLYQEIEAAQARLYLAAGAVEAAQRWWVAWGDRETGAFRMQQEAEAMIAARLLIAQGRPDEARRRLEEWQAEAQAKGRLRHAAEMALLAALAHAAQEQAAQAKQALTTALALGQTAGYRRLFLDAGAPVAALLRELLRELRQEPLAAYARTLLRDFAQTQAPPKGRPEPALLIEPLSPQEQRVLRFLCAGLTNAEIAQTLVVSPNTIKTQVQSIYRKLDVHSREEARMTARELGLLDAPSPRIDWGS
ncbi:MAG TPA: LuxR C-terminal-related transcriptional regulator [Caldilineaceae bacterium]|nr:LuxR C-terminal-related transcriptional regulator [Caldilineaceae bacterium]